MSDNFCFIDSENERDVLFVLGAGASIDSGVPLQKDILNYIFNCKNDNVYNSAYYQDVLQFLSDNFEIYSDNYPDLESVFGYLDYFIYKNECLSKFYTTERIMLIKESLIKMIYYVISESKNHSNKTYKEFWEKISEKNKNISIVTMNYDTKIEESFDFLYSKGGYIDYCVNLMNYDYYEKCNISAFDWWINPRKPVQVYGNKTPFLIKIIKIHGSLNWKYCNCCNQVLLTAWDTSINLEKMKFERVIHGECNNRDIIQDYLCPLDKNIFQTLIIPPSHLKNLANPVINNLIGEAANEIRKAKKIIFIGYSFPDADVHVKALFRKNIQENTKIYVINPNKTNISYKSLSKNIEFYKSSFNEFVKNDLASLLCT